MYDAFTSFTSGLPELLQWVGVILIAAIPYVESYGGSVIGVIAGVNPVVAIIAAIVGNVISMLIFVFVAHRVRAKVAAGRAPKPETPRRQKLRERFDRYGVAGVSLLGQTLLPSQITSAAMVSFGASRNAVIVWQIISIIIWGVLFGVLATFGTTALR
ncbi:Small multidrug efflux protein [Salinibacterium sp. NYA9b]